MTETTVKRQNHYVTATIVNAVFFMLLHLTFVGFTNDDSFFVIVRSEWNSLWELIEHRYLTDSSRVLSETLLFSLIDKPFIIWQILDTLMCMLIFHSLCVMLVNNSYDKKNYLIFLAFAAYPYMHVGSAGWICTTLNYLWPLATLLYSLSGAYRLYRGEKLRTWQYPLYLLAMIFTANCEMPATMLCMTFGMAVVFAVLDKRKKGYEVTGLVIGICGIVFAMSAPGNEERTIMEAENWMPEFFDLNIFEKARLCAVFVFEHFVAIPDVIFFLFALLLVFVGFQKENPIWLKICSVLPVITDIGFTAYYFVKDFIIGRKTNYDFTTPSIYMTDWKTALLQMSEIAGLVIFIIGSIVTLWCVLPNIRTKLVCIWSLGCGFAVRMALMLSPTMFSSWHRTLIFMYFAFLYNIIVLTGLLNKKWTKYVIYGILIIGIAVNLILTIGLQIRKARMW